MRKNDLYSNASASSRNGGGSWVYMDGELYHYGRPGMEWGKHLPGTDWWKETYARNLNNATTYGKKKNNVFTKIGAGLRTARAAARINAGKLKDATGYELNNLRVKSGLTKANFNKAKDKVRNTFTNIKTGTSALYNKAKGYSSEKIAALKDKAHKAYSQSANKVHDFMKSYYSGSHDKNNVLANKTVTGKSGINYLNTYVASAQGKACKAYMTSTVNGHVGDEINSFLQITKYNAIAGAARFLDSIGLDDEVASFLNKFKKK